MFTEIQEQLLGKIGSDKRRKNFKKIEEWKKKNTLCIMPGIIYWTKLGNAIVIGNNEAPYTVPANHPIFNEGKQIPEKLVLLFYGSENNIEDYKDLTEGELRDLKPRIL